jgi:gamma-glutamyltranspeptidase/glutathione hydrolase
MVVTDCALATQIGAQILSRGGNAVDAAVASAFALAVAFPEAGNVGGGGFLVAHMASGNYALDFRETAPRRATRDMYLGHDGKPTQDSRDGWRSAGVPGSVAGLWAAWSKLGSKRLGWPAIMAPAIALAQQGFVVDEAFSQSVGRAQERLLRFPASASLFLPGTAVPPPGTRWSNPDLAKLLRRISVEGPSAFYEGAVAQTIASAMAGGGGLVTAEDIRQYKAKWRTALEFDYRDKHVIGMPPPSSGGVTVALIAHILSGWDVGSLGWHSAAQIHLTAEAMRRAFAARNAKLGDPDFVDNPLGELLSDAWAQAARSTVRRDKATPTAELFPRAASTPEGPHTTHLSVVDAENNAVAMTTTVNEWFGSGATVPGLGFVMNDEMDDFATVPGTANMFGLVQGEPNAIAPGKRMLSSMSPTIVLGASGNVELVLGAAGGSRIITTVFEELSNVVDFGFGAADAVRAPRFHQQDLPDVLVLEPRGLTGDVRKALESMGHAISEASHIADAPAIGWRDGAWQGGAEPRRAGALALGL